MKSILIRNLEEKTMEGLKRRAKQHHRSLQKEVEALLIDAARMMSPDQAKTDSVLDGLRTVSTGQHQSAWSRESLYGEDGR
jgi:plasmid stability protein